MKCKIVIGKAPKIDEMGQIVLDKWDNVELGPLYCDGEMIRTVLVEKPLIEKVQCDKCGNGWGIKNGFKFPIGKLMPFGGWSN